MPCDNSTPPPTPWQSPLGFSATLEASRSPSVSPTPEILPAGFSCRPSNPSLSLFSASWRPPSPVPSAYLIVASEVEPPPAASLPGLSSAPIYSDISAISVYVDPASPAPPCGLGLLF